MTSMTVFRPYSLAAIALATLAACGGGSSTNGASGGGPVDEVGANADYAALADTAAIGSSKISLSVIVNQDMTEDPENVTLTFASGDFSGGYLDGTNLSSSIYSNPANTEFSRVIRLSGTDNLFGTGGIETALADLPGGAVDYNLGWVALTVTDERNGSVYTLQGDATLSASWGNNRIGGTFNNFSGTVSGAGGADRTASNIGRLTLTNAVITGNTFAGGSVSGTGIFGALDNSSDASGIQGRFYGPSADEVGGVLRIEDPDVNVLGAFIAD